MSTIEYTNYFVVAFKGIPEQAKKRVKKSIDFLANDFRHPSLKSEKMKGIKRKNPIFECWGDKKFGIRMTYERRPNDVILMRNIDKHEELLRNP